MTRPPEGSKTILGCANYGVDQTGEWLFFGVKTDGGDVNFIADHHQIGNLSNYIHAMAFEARARRLQAHPETTDLEVRTTQSNPVTNFDLQVDVAGHTAALTCLTASDQRVELQIPADILDGLYKGLPELLAEMQRRKAAQRH